MQTVYDIEFPQLHEQELLDYIIETEASDWYGAYKLKQTVAMSTEVVAKYVGKPIVSVGGGIASTLLVPLYLYEQGIDALYIYCAVENDDQTLIEAVEDKLGLDILRLNPTGNVMPKSWRGFNIWHTYFMTEYLGNWQADPCSRILKREAILRFMKAHKTPSVYLGISQKEHDRWLTISANYSRQGIKMHAPLYEYPDYFNGATELELCERYLGYIPEAYLHGMTHNNCDSFCIKAGLKQLRLGYLYNRDTYIAMARRERAWNLWFGTNYTMFRKSKHGKRQPITMHNLLEGFDKDTPIEQNEENTPQCVWCD